MTRTMKRMLSLMLVLCMALALMPTAWAAYEAEYDRTLTVKSGGTVSFGLDDGKYGSSGLSITSAAGLPAGLSTTIKHEGTSYNPCIVGTAGTAGTYNASIEVRNPYGAGYTYLYRVKIVVEPKGFEAEYDRTLTVKSGETVSFGLDNGRFGNSGTSITSAAGLPAGLSATIKHEDTSYNPYIVGTAGTAGTYNASVEVRNPYGAGYTYLYRVKIVIQPSTTTQTMPATTFSVKAGEKFDRQITESWWSTSVALKTSYTVSPTVSTAAPAIAKSGTYQGSTLNNQFLHLQGSIGKVGIYKYEIVVNWSNNGNEFKYIFPVTVTVTGDTFVNPFTDVKPSDWFYSDVMSAVKMGLVNGMTPTTYEPKGNLTICQAIKLAACMNQYYTDGQVTLQNSPTGNWYDSYVNYAIKKGIITYDQFEGQYNNTATRANYVMIFANALPDSEFKAINTIKDNSIPDVKTTDLYGAAVYKLYRAGILTGSGDAATYRYFLPKNNIIRSEVAAILTRMMDQTARINFTI